MMGLLTSFCWSDLGAKDLTVDRNSEAFLFSIFRNATKPSADNNSPPAPVPVTPPPPFLMTRIYFLYILILNILFIKGREVGRAIWRSNHEGIRIIYFGEHNEQRLFSLQILVLQLFWGVFALSCIFLANLCRREKALYIWHILVAGGTCTIIIQLWITTCQVFKT